MISSEWIHFYNLNIIDYNDFKIIQSFNLTDDWLYFIDFINLKTLIELKMADKLTGSEKL